MAVSDDLTAAYRDRMGAAVNGLLARLAAAWLAVWNPERPLYSAGLAGDITAEWTEGVQAWAGAESARWLLALTLLAGGRPGPYAVPGGLVGSSAAGGPLGLLTGLAPSVWLARTSAGGTAEEAAAAVASWLARIADSEPYRVANAVATHNARTDPRLTGRSRRLTRAGSCSWCQALAGRGMAYTAAGFPAHGHCRCTAEPEIRTKR